MNKIIPISLIIIFLYFISWYFIIEMEVFLELELLLYHITGVFPSDSLIYFLWYLFKFSLPSLHIILIIIAIYNDKLLNQTNKKLWLNNFYAPLALYLTICLIQTLFASTFLISTEETTDNNLAILFIFPELMFFWLEINLIFVYLRGKNLVKKNRIN